MSDDERRSLERLLLVPCGDAHDNRRSRNALLAGSMCLLCIVAALAVVLALPFVSWPSPHLRSKVEDPKEGIVWIGGYAMKIDPKMLAVSLIETSTNEQDGTETLTNVGL